LTLEQSFNDLAGFWAGKERLPSIEQSELSDLTEKSLNHIQCHFGLDNLAWAQNFYTNTPTSPGQNSPRWKKVRAIGGVCAPSDMARSPLFAASTEARLSAPGSLLKNQGSDESNYFVRV
jgi:hypothetical protein